MGESAVPTRCPEQYSSIFVFRSNKFSSISQFLEVIQVEKRCQRYRRYPLNSMRAFFFSDPNFFFIICTSESEVSAVPTPFPKLYASIFVFLSKIIFLISQFLEVAYAKSWCKRYQRETMNSM